MKQAKDKIRYSLLITGLALCLSFISFAPQEKGELLVWFEITKSVNDQNQEVYNIQFDYLKSQLTESQALDLMYDHIKRREDHLGLMRL